VKASLHCDAAVALATIDAVAAAAAVAVGTYLVITPANSECCRALQVVGIPPLLAGLVYTASAVYGYASYGGCRQLRAHAAHDARATVPSASSR